MLSRIEAEKLDFLSQANAVELGLVCAEKIQEDLDKIVAAIEGLSR